MHRQFFVEAKRSELPGLLDDIITKDGRTYWIMQLNANSQTLLQICFLEDVLSITNISSLELQSDKKGFTAVYRAMQLTCLHSVETNGWITPKVRF